MTGSVTGLRDTVYQGAPMTATTTTAPVADHGMLTVLGVLLPGLDDTDLAELTNRAFTQVQKRVGSELSAGLTDQQLAEFEKLVDSNDDEGASEWLSRTVPDYRTTVLIERLGVITEVVRAMAGDTTATRGQVRSVRLMDPTLEHLEVLFHHEDVVTSADTGELVVIAGRRGTERPVTLRWNLIEHGPRRFAARSSMALSVHDHSVEEMNRICRRWNGIHAAAHAGVSRDGDDLTLEISGAIPLQTGISVEQLASTVSLVCQSFVEAFDLILGWNRESSE